MISFDRKPPEIELTNQQNLVLNATNECVIADACPGSGKSTLLKMAAFANPGKKILYLAYNKSIVADVAGKLPMNCNVATFHSFGLSVVMENIRAKVVPWKFKNLTRSNEVVDLVHAHISIAGEVDNRTSWEETCVRFNMDKRKIGFAMECLKHGSLNTSEISFAEMISLPVQMKMPIDGYDLVLVDEKQDMNESQFNLVNAIPKERVIFVGDKNQAVNYFSGSDPNIDRKIKKQYRDNKTFLIDKTFRCPHKIVENARLYCDEITGDIPGGKVSFEFMDEVEIKKNSLVMSRLKIHLVRVVKKLIFENIEFSAKKEVFSDIVKNAERSIGGQKRLTGAIAYEKRNRAEYIGEYKRNGMNTTMLKAKHDATIEMLTSCKSITEVKNMIWKITENSKTKNGVLLSTGHGAKGLEYENTYVIGNEDCDMIAERNHLQWQKEAEKNIQYVMATRSSNNITYID